MKYTGLIFTSALFILFLVMAFSGQPCDIDKQYLSCMFKPFTWIKFVGIILFWGSAFVFVGHVLDLMGIEIYNKSGHLGSAIAGGIALLGFLMMVL